MLGEGFFASWPYKAKLKHKKGLASLCFEIKLKKKPSKKYQTKQIYRGEK